MTAQAYTNKNSHYWEYVNSLPETKRMRVPGGYIYAVTSWEDNKEKPYGVVFVPLHPEDNGI